MKLNTIDRLYRNGSGRLLKPVAIKAIMFSIVYCIRVLIIEY